MEQADLGRARELLREYFGYTAFHPGQEAMIAPILAGRDVLGIMPTGAGKSVCYQIPALLLPGITLVVSPLISLMKDQVDGLRRMGIPAALLNSSISAKEQSETCEALANGAVKLLYIAPERLEAAGFASYLLELPVSMVAVDEAHCISQWGHDFRPSYRYIRRLIEAFPTRPVVSAFTATATRRVREDILTLLGQRDPFTLTTGFDRPNLYFAVSAPRDREQFILDYLRENAGSSGIVYCLTRKQVENLAQALSRAGVSALPYHAGMPDEARKFNQEAFRDDKADVIVATNAFGMGIDKSNVRFVIHCGMPKTLENYYQEAGRAGRDGEKAECILLYSAQDIVTNRFLIDRGSENSGVDKEEDYRKLQEMVDYCNGEACLRGYILRYFGMENAPQHCGNCSGCSDDGESTDITVEAQKIISCVKRMGNRFGGLLVAQVLRGADTKKIRDLGFTRLSTYGIMKEYSEKAIKELISCLVARGFLEVRGGEYPVLFAGERAMRFLRDRETLSMKRKIDRTDRKEGRVSGEHAPLFEALRELRRRIAAEQQVAPYLVFSDATLADMCAVLPRDRDELRLVSGVGRFKMEQYGEEFLFVIREYMDDNNLVSLPSARTRRNAPASAASNGRRQSAPDTVMTSYALYRQGKTLDEIASRRGIARTTVEHHLIKAHRAGHAVDLDAFIPAAYREDIFAVIEEHGTERLRAVKEQLPDEVSYTAVRFAVEAYKSRLALSAAEMG